ncbi:alpha-2-macroglobulin family protein [Pseudooceanicola marinus]|uniref:alpha-2-macroglobulin family protein n=1 Tax=Pseudooceanicola marinus TaxID=396013 RepID=UPI001CD51F2A|nr:alpha-2-macroglobulin family protein [Pseudooceanicola marinus]MCA1337844.1 alpha-2-macroglobulin family protein [Pseudooceanicola marinus]
MKRILAALALGLAALGPVQAQEGPLPEKRMLVFPNTDFAGRDLGQLFDTTLQACRTACLTDADCTAVTFNSRNNSCFPKATVTGQNAYDGAYSARVIPVESRAQDLGRMRAADLPEVATPARLEAARDLALRISWFHSAGDSDTGTLRDTASSAARAGDLLRALRYAGAATAASDASADWVLYSDMLRQVTRDDAGQTATHHRRAVPAALNAYLRAGSDGEAAQALYLLAQAFEAVEEGSDMVPALRLASRLSNRRDIAELLERAVSLYGFRVEDYEVQADAALPRVCMAFTDPLAKTGVDYGDYVQLPDGTMAVEAEGNRLCIEGGAHGQSYSYTLRAGLPSRTGEALAADATFRVAIPDRAPTLRFPGRGYVLAKGAGAALPIDTVNLDRVDLRLFKVTDRGLIRTIQRQLFNRQIGEWEVEEFAEAMATEIWTGEGEVRKDRNTDVTTRLPLDTALEGQAPGVYALRARAPGRDEYETPAATQWFVLTDLGLTTWTGADGLHAVVRGLGDAGAKEGVTLTLLSNANAVLAEAETDDQGVASFAPGLLRGTGGAAPALLLARAGDDDMAFLSLKDPAFDLTDRGVAGREPAGAIDMFLTTDRGAYRAGETIHVTALARDGTARALDGLPVTAILTRPDGVEYARQARADGQAGGYVFSFPVGTTVPRGSWRLALKSDLDAPALAQTTVLVEDFLPERIDAALSLAGEGPMPLASTRDLSVEARYLFGAPAGDLTVSGSTMLATTGRLDAFPGYRFGRHDAETTRERFYFDSTTTDAQGRATLPLAFDGFAPETPMPAEATVYTDIFEGSGRPIERRLTQLVLPAEPFIGIRPAFDDVVPEGTEAAFRLIALDDQLDPAEMEVAWTLNRVTTRYQWYNLYGNWEWESFTTRTEVTSGTAALGADPVEVAAPVDWGRYELVVESTADDRTAASVDFYAGWYVPADTTTTPDTLELSLDAESYAPGDEARLRLVPRYAGTALVSVMSNRLIDMQVVEVTEGENLIPLPVTEDWGAGAYVTATVLRPMDLDQGHNPARALGLDYASVAPGDKALDVTFTSAPEADPRGGYTAQMQVDGVAQGDQAYVTLAAVDLGILNLTGFDSPDPQGHYFGQRRLGMEIRDLYGRLIDPTQGEMGRIRSGGDAAASSRFASPPPTEDLVTWFSGPLPVSADGTVEARFDIPAFNGTLRLMAVAWSEAGVGAAEQDVLVRDPVVVTTSTPNFLAPGDRSSLLLELVHATGPAGEMALSVSAPGMTLGDLPATVTLAEGEKQSFRVPLSAETVGDYAITVSLTTRAGDVMTKTLTLPVRRNTPEVSRTQRFDLAAGATFTLDENAFAGFDVDTAHAVLSAGPLARLDVPGVLFLLDQYPYGCTEQVTSKALPLLSLAPVADLLGLATQTRVDERVARAIDKVLARQTASGSFRLWAGSDGTSWLDAYVTDFLSRARLAGHEVPDAAFTRALDNLRNLVNFAPDFEADTNGGGEALAYQLMVLAREGEAAMGDLRYYADVKGDEFATPLAAAQLGAALAMYGDQPRADAMFARAQAKIAPRGTAEEIRIRNDFGTRMRDISGLLTLAAEAGSKVVDRQALLDRLAEVEGPLSTQESAWTLMAASALLEDPAAPALSVDGTRLTGPLVRTLPGTAPEPVAIRNEGSSPTDLTLTTLGVPEGPLAAGGYGYGIDRAYYTPEGERVSPETVASGTRLVVVLTVTPFEETGARLMVNDPLPAGFEIDNPRLLRSGDIDALDWLEVAPTQMTEFRSDRFLAALDWRGDEAFSLAYMVRAVSPGDYLAPAASVEDMYRPRYRANTGEMRITVTP